MAMPGKKNGHLGKVPADMAIAVGLVAMLFVLRPAAILLPALVVLLRLGRRPLCRRCRPLCLRRRSLALLRLRR